MYTVVGCSECRALWIVAERPDRTECPRCRTSHQFDGLRTLYQDDDKAKARRARSALLADRAGVSDSEMTALAGSDLDLEDVGIEDAEYLAAAGLDAEDVAASADRAGPGNDAGSRSPREAVLEAIDGLDTPSEDAVIAAAKEAGVAADRARAALEALHEGGQLAREGNQYRRV